MEVIEVVPMGKIVPMAIWGFLVGFVGFGSLWRLGEPIGDWLVPVKKNANVTQGIVRALVICFLFLTNVLMLVGMMTILFAMRGIERTPDTWRGLWAVAYGSALAGFLFYGLINRISGRR